MALTSIGDQKTPGRPLETSFAAETGTPSANQEVLLIGHKDAVSGSATAYEVVLINASGDEEAALIEANAKFGAGSELAKMVVAAVKANAGRSNFPALKAVPLAFADDDFGAADEALTAAKRVKAEYIVSPYEGSDDTLRDAIELAARTMSGAQRVENDQYGTIAVAAEMATDDPADLPEPDSQFFSGAYLRDTGTGPDENAYSVAEVAAAYAALMAGNPSPFNPQHGMTLYSVPAPAQESDRLTVGAGLESETVLNKGWTPLRVLPTGDVAVVRCVTSRITTGDGVTAVTSYYDVTDFNVLYFWRKTVKTRISQPDLVNVKASAETANLIKSELIRLATVFEDQGMFQNVANLAKKFQVVRSTSDRHRFDIFTPVNIIPGLAVVAGNLQATTEGDTLSV